MVATTDEPLAAATEIAGVEPVPAAVDRVPHARRLPAGNCAISRPRVPFVSWRSPCTVLSAGGA